MHGHAAVPHDEVPGLPDVRKDESALSGVLVQIAEERARFGRRPAFDGAGMTGQVVRLRQKLTFRAAASIMLSVKYRIAS
jgi:hypothetical protein